MEMVTFQPRHSVSAAMVQAQTDVQAWRDLCRERPGLKSSDLGREFVGTMQLDREAASSLLRDQDPDTRLRAIAFVANVNHWPAAERFPEEVLHLAFDDPVPAIRGAALQALLMLGPRQIADPSGWLRSLLAKLFPLDATDGVGDNLRTMAPYKKLIDRVAKRWEAIAGPQAARMRESCAVTEAYLEHPDPRLRRAAMLALAHHWNADDQFRETYERIALHDPDPSVRALAVSRVGASYFHTDNRRIGEVIARLLLDERNARDIRAAAYLALFNIRGMPPQVYPEIASDNFRVPEDVDWEFVKSFLPE
jgi:hypothetical protein